MSRSFLFSVGSGILLALCFSNFPLGFLAWVSLIPLLLTLSNASSRTDALLSGLVAALAFFGISLSWLTYVSVFGWVFIICLETIFFLIFAVSVYEGRKIQNPFLKSLWIALAWTVSELLRSEIPIFGFGWNLLGFSQTNYPWVLQSANAIGAYGLGFVIVFINACLFSLFAKTQGQRPFQRKSDYGLVAIVALVMILLLAHGRYEDRPESTPNGKLRISLVQGNIPQNIKWEPVARNKILEVYSKLTELASFDSPDVIFWPEAAFPGYFNQDLAAGPIRELVRKIQTPLMVGSPHLEGSDIAYNSAYLLGSDGEVKARYDKLLLVPFGEYVPLKPIFGWLEPLAYSLGISDFSAGHEHTVFELQNGELPFSVLICFENTFANLARSFVDRGARFLAVMTNDAWFGRSAAPYQHLRASILRAVENGVPVIHVANTGVSAFISRKGEVLDRVQDKEGRDIFIAGRKTYSLPMEKRETLYRKGGWFFPYGALAVFVIMLAIIKLELRNKN